jgi:hypothetical protein
MQRTVLGASHVPEQVQQDQRDTAGGRLLTWHESVGESGSTPTAAFDIKLVDSWTIDSEDMRMSAAFRAVVPG